MTTTWTDSFTQADGPLDLVDPVGIGWDFEGVYKQFWTVASNKAHGPGPTAWMELDDYGWPIQPIGNAPEYHATDFSSFLLFNAPMVNQGVLSVSMHVGAVGRVSDGTPGGYPWTSYGGLVAKSTSADFPSGDSEPGVYEAFVVGRDVSGHYRALVFRHGYSFDDFYDSTTPPSWWNGGDLDLSLELQTDGTLIFTVNGEVVVPGYNVGANNMEQLRFGLYDNGVSGNNTYDNLSLTTEIAVIASYAEVDSPNMGFRHPALEPSFGYSYSLAMLGPDQPDWPGDRSATYTHSYIDQIVGPDQEPFSQVESVSQPHEFAGADQTPFVQIESLSMLNNILGPDQPDVINLETISTPGEIEGENQIWWSGTGSTSTPDQIKGPRPASPPRPAARGGKRTRRFGLSIFNDRSDRFDELDWKYGVADRKFIDHLLGSTHHHNGVTVDSSEPPAPTVLLHAEAGGTLAPGSTVYYKYSLVDEEGQEQLASKMAVIHVPRQLAAPTKAPTLTMVTSASTDVRSGATQYVVTAWTLEDTQETTPSPSATALAAPGKGVTITFPALPSGAGGWNVYRKDPADTEFRFLASVTAEATDAGDDFTVFSTPPRRTAPTTNTTNTKFLARVTLPADVALAGNSSWRVFRTTNPSDWGHSLVADLTNAQLNSTVTDYGHAPSEGSPSELSAAVNSPDKIDLESELQGFLPPAHTLIPHQLTLGLDGPTVPGVGDEHWVCEWDHAKIYRVQAWLRRGSTAAATISVGIEIYRSGSWLDGFSPYDRAEIALGANIGAVKDPIQDGIYLQKGDAVRVRIFEGDGGTGEDLRLGLKMWVKDGSFTESYVWETT